MHLLGGNLIHVKYTNFYLIRPATGHRFPDRNSGLGAPSASIDPHRSFIIPINDDHDDDDAEVMETSCEWGLQHAICVANQSEYSAYNEAISGNAVVAAREQPDFDIPTCDKRHANCKMCGSRPKRVFNKDRKALTVDLNVLGVCRQLYEEANHLLWATNTFSFDDPDTCRKFFDSLNPAQKRNLTKIHINANIGGSASNYYTNADQRARWNSQYWGKALKIRTLNTLKGVRTLHLCVNQDFERISHPHYNSAAIAAAVERVEEAQVLDMEPILHLRTLTLKDVTVVISDDKENFKQSGRSEHRWTVAKKNEYAKSIHTQLVDPLGAQVVKTEAETAALARKKEFKSTAATQIRSSIMAWKTIRDRANECAKWARGIEAEAELAAQKAMQVPKKTSKRAKKLQDAAERLEVKAMNARATVNSAMEKKKSWREQVVNAREKYKRAIARLGATPEERQVEDEIAKMIDELEGFDTDIEVDEVAQTDGSDQSGDDTD